MEETRRKSQGLDVTGYNWRGFYTGGEVSDADYQKWADTLKSLYDSDEWKQAAEASGLVPLWRGGDAFEAYVGEQVEEMRQISQDIGVM